MARVGFVFNALLSSAKTRCTATSFEIEQGCVKVVGRRAIRATFPRADAIPGHWELSVYYSLGVHIAERWTGGDRYGEFFHSLLFKGCHVAVPPEFCPRKLLVLYAVVVGDWRRVDGYWVHWVPRPGGTTARVAYRLGVDLSVDGKSLSTGTRAMLAGRVP